MAANVETMFSVRKKPWHGIGTVVQDAPCSREAIRLAGLDWEIIQKDVYTDGGTEISGYKANVRSTDQSVLGVVSDRYQIVQNRVLYREENAFLCLRVFRKDLLLPGMR